MRIRVHFVREGEVVEYEASETMRILHFIRATREARNCAPNKLVTAIRVPGYALVSMHFADNEQIIVRFV